MNNTKEMVETMREEIKEKINKMQDEAEMPDDFNISMNITFGGSGFEMTCSDKNPVAQLVTLSRTANDIIRRMCKEVGAEPGEALEIADVFCQMHSNAVKTIVVLDVLGKLID